MRLAGRSHRSRLALLASALAAAWLLVGCAGAFAALRMRLEARYGAKVNATTGASFCTRISGASCQEGEKSVAAGGLSTPNGVAVASDGNLYVADAANQRVQELTPTGEFVLMFGREVNATKVSERKQEEAEDKQPAVTAEEEDICTKQSSDDCQAGTAGHEASALERPSSIAIDSGGHVYVAQQTLEDNSVVEYTESGQFVLKLGKEVNATEDATPGATAAQKNLCTAASKDTCKAGAQSPVGGSSERGAFRMTSGLGNVLAAGGPEDLLYVGDEHRVQEFHADGEWAGEIALSSLSAEKEVLVRALTVDQATGEVYLAYWSGATATQLGSKVFEFNAAGTSRMGEITVPPSQPDEPLNVQAIALKPDGLLAVSDIEGQIGSTVGRGLLLDAVTGRRVTEFTTLPGPGTGGIGYVSGFAFSSSGEQLYGAYNAGQDVAAYQAVEVGELRSKGAGCKVEGEQESRVSFECTLEGEVDPFGVDGTEAWAQWSTEAALGGSGTRETSKLPVTTGTSFQPFGAPIAGLRPNETYYWRLAGYDENAQPPEAPLLSEMASFTTPVVAPKVIGTPESSFVGPFSAVLSGAVNPENASTEYFFEYGPCAQLAGCEAVASTEVAGSSVYGQTGATLEAKDLQAATTYSYRLVAVNAKGEADAGPEETFTTGPAPVPVAVTGAATGVTDTAALISGTVNPGGRPAVYTFEVGASKGAQTQYGTVVSATAGSGSEPVSETFQLEGLQPGTQYAYRIQIESAYGTSYGAPATFTTAPAPTLLGVPSAVAMLPTPTFPKVKEPGKARKGKGKNACKGAHGKRAHGKRRCQVAKRRGKHGRKGKAKHGGKRKGKQAARQARHDKAHRHGATHAVHHKRAV